MLRQLAVLACVIVLAVAAPSARAATTVVAPDFVIENATPNTGFNNPTAFAFTPDGRILVAEKRGVVRVVRNGVKLSKAMWSAEAEVLSNGDRGLVGIAVDPNYRVNHYVYFLYTTDPDSDGVDDDEAAFGRLTRYRTSSSDSSVVDLATRKVLIGAVWRQGFPSGSSSHTTNCLRWGADGSLLVTSGEGSHYSTADGGGQDPDLFAPNRTDPLEDIGAFRAQYVNSLGGKLLRVNPVDGGGYASNPFYDGNPQSNRSRVWAYGFRNPFRFCVRPATGSTDPNAGDPGAVYVADVGWNAWEEVDVAPHGGMNFGWPNYEGLTTPAQYPTLNPPRGGLSSIGTPDNPSIPSPPTVTWSHTDSTLGTPGLRGNCVIGGVFYSGQIYPTRFRNRMFFADFGLNWIKVATFDAEHRITGVTDFAEGTQGPVDFATDPLTGDVFFISIYGGSLSRIRYTGPIEGNTTPVAVATSARGFGSAPFTATFSGSGSSDFDGDPLTSIWNFGDGTGATGLSVSHTYDTPGQFDAVLTISDTHGAFARDTVSVNVWKSVPFPSTTDLDPFHRANGPIGAPWVGSTNGLVIASNGARQVSSTSYPIWNGAVFGPDQEVFVTFDSLATGGERDLMLKVQGTSWQDGHAQVHYTPDAQSLIMLTYDRTAGWVRIGGPFAVTLGPGDRLGARMYATGMIEAYKNGAVIGSASAGGWPFASGGGRIGAMFASAIGTRLRAFGGGNVRMDVSTPPRVTVFTPADSAFFADRDTVRLSGLGEDDQDLAGMLRYHWQVDLHHNNHVHPAVETSESPTLSFVAENHDDGTGVWLAASLTVTDSQGMTATSTVHLFPAIDLQPTAVATFPSEPGAADSVTYRFAILDNGRMPAPISHWRLLAGATVLAEGDTLVPSGGRVDISRRLPPLLTAGTYSLQLVVDSRGAVPETNETNNVASRTLVVRSGAGVVGVPRLPHVIALSAAYPNPSRGHTSFALELPAAARVGLAVYDVQGREVWSTGERVFPPGTESLEWDGTRRLGGPAPAGIYFARVNVEARVFLRRLVLMR